ncbi:DUF4390 domain-containing protein [Aquabacterium sp.]|uniref:DUF4390 domain-containing protein n=1 Tax=Aquabacterium sp. TaxID=1872578 RepID=UPI0035AE2DE8
MQRSTAAALAAILAQPGRQALAAPGRSGIELARLSAQRSDEGVLLSYEVRFDLSRDIEQALYKGLSVVFVAEAEVHKSRWYWTDQVVATATRRWRLAYQPLTRQWRLSFDGLSRHYSRLSEVLEVLRHGIQWRIADALPGSDSEDYYVDFVFKLDTSELPRPMQFGLGGQSDWDLIVQRRTSVPLPR